MNGQQKDSYEFCGYRLTPSEHLLAKDGSPVMLSPKAFEILVLFVENPGELITKQDIMQSVWPESFVEESNIQVHISAIRKALGSPQLIETVPRKGYRFADEVKVISAGGQGTIISADGVTTYGPKFDRRRWLSKSAAIVASSALAISLLIVAFLVFDRPLLKRSRPFKNMAISKQTDSGQVTHAAISPDGTNLVYPLLQNGLSSLWIRNIPSGAEKQIVEPGKNSFDNLVFSKNGDEVYFTQDEGPLGTLYRVPIIGAAPRKVLDDIFGRITFSPDGTRFAFSRGNEKTSEYSLVLANKDGSEQNVLAVSRLESGLFYWPAWSPDGRSIVLFKKISNWDEYGNRFGLTKIDADTGAETSLGGSAWQSIGYISWLRDGSGVVFTASNRASAPAQIWFVSADGADPQQITNDTNRYSELSVDDKGESMVATQNDTRSSIWINDKPGDFSEFRSVSAGPNLAEGIYGISISSDGKQVVFTARVNGNWDVWSVNSVGGNPRRLTTNDFYDMEPQISPDGSKIVYVSQIEDGRTHLWTMNFDGSEKTQLTDRYFEDYPVISTDGKWVFFVAFTDLKTEKLCKVSIQGGEIVELPNIAPVRSRLAPSPDGKQIAFATLDEMDRKHKHKIVVLSVEGGDPVKTLEVPPKFLPNTIDIKWRPDGKALTIKTADDPGWNLWDLSLDSGQRARLTNFPSGQIFAFDWTGDSRFLAVARGDAVRDIVLIKDLQ